MASNLIAIPSVSGEELAVMKSVQRWCHLHEIPYQVFAKDPGRPNLIVSIGNGEGPTIAMNGHLDTVPVSDLSSWRTAPFVPVLSDDGERLYGRGASDM